MARDLFHQVHGYVGSGGDHEVVHALATLPSHGRRAVVLYLDPEPLEPVEIALVAPAPRGVERGRAARLDQESEDPPQTHTARVHVGLGNLVVTDKDRRTVRSGANLGPPGSSWDGTDGRGRLANGPSAGSD